MNNSLTVSLSVFDKQLLPIVSSMFISEIETDALFYDISFSA
jgi:hypothetical protein